MATPRSMSYARNFPVAPEVAFDALVGAPLESVFHRRHGPLPPIRSTRRTDAEPDKPWGQVGQARIVQLADGGSMRENAVVVDRPEVFGYEMDEIKGAMAALTSRVDGSWAFKAAGTGTCVTWTWHVHPRSAIVAPALAVLGVMWQGYARKAFDGLEAILLPSR